MASESCWTDSSSEAASARVAGSSARRVAFPGPRQRQLECKLCACTAGSRNPLRLADRGGSETHGAFRPWAKYIDGTMGNGERVRVPAGRLCLLCLNCYRQLGYHIKYGSLSKYLEQMQTNPAEHQEKFHKSLRVYISKLQDRPNQHRLQPSCDHLASPTTIDDKQRQGIKRAQTWTFIEKEYWDERTRGPLPKEKLCEQIIDGEKKWGIMVAQERAGHHRFEAFETKEMVESEQVCDTQQGALPEEALMNARDTLSKAHDKERRFRSQHLVSDVPKPAPVTARRLDQFTELLQCLGNNRAAIVGKDDETTEPWTAPQGLPRSEDTSEDGDIETQIETLDIVWDERSTRLQMAGCFVEPNVASAAPGKRKGKRPLSGGSEPPAKKAGTASATQSECGSMASADYDGRVANALKSYRQAIATAQLKLDAVSFGEGINNSNTELIEAIYSRHKAIREIARNLKGLETKIKRAKGLALQEAHKDVLELQTRCSMFSTFNAPETLALSPSPPTRATRDPFLHCHATRFAPDQGWPECSRSPMPPCATTTCSIISVCVLMCTTGTLLEWCTTSAICEADRHNSFCMASGTPGWHCTPSTSSKHWAFLPHHSFLMNSPPMRRCTPSSAPYWVNWRPRSSSFWRSRKVWQPLGSGWQRCWTRRQLDSLAPGTRPTWRLCGVWCSGRPAR